MNDNNFRLATLLLLIFAIAAAVYVFAPRPIEDKRVTRIAVTGDAVLQTAPDTAEIVFSVMTQNVQAFAAQQENARKSQSAIAAIKTVAGNAILTTQTSDYSLQPQQSYRDDNKLPSIIGYEAKNTIKITLSDLNQVGATIDAATKSGANAVENISFTLREKNAAQGSTLAQATQQAMAKAEGIANALNGKIIRIVETREGGVVSNSQTESDEYKAMSNSSSIAYRSAPMKPTYTTPVEAGSLNVRSQVVLVVEIAVSR